MPFDNFIMLLTSFLKHFTSFNISINFGFFLDGIASSSLDEISTLMICLDFPPPLTLTFPPLPPNFTNSC